MLIYMSYVNYMSLVNVSLCKFYELHISLKSLELL